MAKTIERLSPLAVERATRPGMYHDGRGLYLHVGPTGRKSWLFRYQIGGKPRQMGLGGYPDIGLAKARELLAKARELKAQGIDPLDQKLADRQAARADAAKAVTFRACAEKYIRAHRASWRNAKHTAQWVATLTTYAYPQIGSLPAATIETGHVTKVLEPIWTQKPETASRLRGRIEAVLDYAATHGWRGGPNPAAWKGHLEHVFPTPRKIRKVKHHPALPWREIGAFMAKLRRQEGPARMALELAILTGTRSGEVIGARWSEIDMSSVVWTIPPERMKAGKEHRVPLPDDAMALLRELTKLRPADGGDAFVFPGTQPGKPLANTALLMTLRRMDRGDLTTHGFRSTFRDWCAETGKPADVAEAALAHTLGNKTQLAYLRGDLFDRRRKLMQQWAEFCARPEPEAQVVPLRPASAG